LNSSKRCTCWQSDLQTAWRPDGKCQEREASANGDVISWSILHKNNGQIKQISIWYNDVMKSIFFITFGLSQEARKVHFLTVY